MEIVRDESSCGNDTRGVRNALGDDRGSCETGGEGNSTMVDPEIGTIGVRSKVADPLWVSSELVRATGEVSRQPGQATRWRV